MREGVRVKQKKERLLLATNEGNGIIYKKNVLNESEDEGGTRENNMGRK